MAIQGRYVVIGIVLLSILGVGAVFLNLNPRNAPTEKITVAEDAWVYDSAPDANYGNWTKIDIETTEGGRACTWLKFNLTSLPDGISIETAKINLYSRQLHISGTVNAHFSEIDSWSEATITHKNAPEFEPTLDSTNVNIANHFYSWTVTSAIKSAYQGDKTATFVLEGNGWVYFDSKEGTNPPYLEITYTPQT